MDENSLESYGPTIADVGYRCQMWRTGCPVTTLINAVCFAWPATTLAARHDASRLMGQTIATQKSGVKRGCSGYSMHTGSVRDVEGMAGTTSDVTPTEKNLLILSRTTNILISRKFHQLSPNSLVTGGIQYNSIHYDIQCIFG